jgi:uncharacterized membrane protein YbhN (UPF0104 family)
MLDDVEEAPGTALVVHDDRPRRIRSSIDGARLVVLLAVLLILAAFAITANGTSAGANDDLSRAVHHIPELLVRALTAVGTFGALVLPVALILRELTRSRPRRLIESLVTALAAVVVTFALSEALQQAPTAALVKALTLHSHSGTITSALDPYIAGYVAFGAALGILHEAPWRGWFTAALVVYVISAFAATQAAWLSLVVSVLLGAIIAAMIRYFAGAVNTRPDGAQLVDALVGAGLGLRRLERRPHPQTNHRSYRGFTPDGQTVIVDVLDRDDVASGLLYRVYRNFRVRREVTSTPELTIERVAERRTMLALMAARAEAPLPELVATARCGPDAIALAYADVEVTPMAQLGSPPSEQQIMELWQAAEKLHGSGLSHPGLIPERIGVDRAGRVVLPVFDEGNAFAGELRINLDRAQLLITSAELIGADATIRIAHDAIGIPALTSVLPVLQPVGLPRPTRRRLRQTPGLTDELRQSIRALSDEPPPEALRLERFRPRTVVTLIALIVAAWLLVGQLGSLDLATVFRTAKWAWVPLLLLASVATYFAAALSLLAYVREKVSFWRTLIAQCAASFTGFVMPPAVGGLAINVRFLQRSGLSSPAAATSVGLGQLVNGVSHVVLLIALAAFTGTQAEHHLPVPGWVFIALGGVAAFVLLLLAVPAPRRWVLARMLPPVREALPRLLDLVSSPYKLAQGIGSALLLNFCYVAALWFSVHAFSGHVDAVGVAVVYLAGGAIGSIAPTPGGLGAVEAALSTGLAASGMPTAAAVSAVLLYRLATFWLPVPLGWLSLNWLQRHHAI